MEIEKKWTMPITNWGLIMNQFMLIFENRPDIRELITESRFYLHKIMDTASGYDKPTESTPFSLKSKEIRFSTFPL